MKQKKTEDLPTYSARFKPKSVKAKKVFNSFYEEQAFKMKKQSIKTVLVGLIYAVLCVSIMILSVINTWLYLINSIKGTEGFFVTAIFCFFVAGLCPILWINTYVKPLNRWKALLSVTIFYSLISLFWLNRANLI